MNFNSSQSNILPKINYRDLIIFILPVLIFILYLFVYNPGVLTVGSFNQLHQIATGKFTAAQPIFHTFLLMIFIKIFNTPFYFGLFQILIFALIWMGICKYHRDDSAKSSNEFVVQFIITFIICLIPINAVYSVTISSNILFSYSLMFLGFLIKIMLDKNGQIDRKIIILMALTLAVMSGLNNYGIIIALISLMLITYYLFKKGNSENTFVMLIGLAVLGIFLIGSLNFVYDVQKDTLNIPSDDSFGNEINLNLARSQFFSAANDEPTESYENINSANLGTSKYNLVNSFVSFWRGNFILDNLFDNPIVYIILSIMLLALIYVRTEAKEIFLLYVPTFLQTIISIFTSQNNMYSNILIFYLAAIICVGMFFKSNLKLNDISNISPLRAKPQSETQPTYEVQQNTDDNYYSYLESEIDELTMDDINEMLGEPLKETSKINESAPQNDSEETQKAEKPKTNEPAPQQDSDLNEYTDIPADSDLIDEILKEMGKK